MILKNTTESPKKIQVPDHCSEEDLKVTDLSQLPYINNFQKVAVDVKVFDATEPMIVTGGKKSKKLPLVTKLVRPWVTLWEQHIGLLKDGSSYNLKNFIVREYGTVKYLSMPKEGWKITPIDNIGEVEQSETDIIEHQKTDIQCCHCCSPVP